MNPKEQYLLNLSQLKNLVIVLKLINKKKKEQNKVKNIKVRVKL